MGHSELHKMPILCRYTFLVCLLLLEHFWNPWSVPGLWAVTVEHTDNSIWWDSSTVTSFSSHISNCDWAQSCLLQYATSCYKLMITHIFVFSRFKLILNRHLLLPSQLGYFNADCGTNCVFDVRLVRISSVCLLLFLLFFVFVFVVIIIFCCLRHRLVFVSRCAFASLFSHIHVICAYILIISQSSIRQCFT
jgi:hypothetical protein